MAKLEEPGRYRRPYDYEVEEGEILDPGEEAVGKSYQGTNHDSKKRDRGNRHVEYTSTKHRKVCDRRLTRTEYVRDGEVDNAIGSKRRLDCIVGGLECRDKYKYKSIAEYEETVELKLPELIEEEVIDRVEESRKRRQAILEKFQNRKPDSEQQPDQSQSQVGADQIVSARKLPLQNRKGLNGGASKGKGGGLQVERSGPNDNWDNKDGHYECKATDILGSRYEVTLVLGSGVSSTVVRAKDLKAGKDDPEEVAIKIIHNNGILKKAGQLELVILKKLAAADPKDKWHCVRLISSFTHRDHLCLVLESLDANLSKVIKDFGRKTGHKLAAVRACAEQLFISLKLLKECGVLHCDIKPDNVLVNKARNCLKVCDFGVSMFAGKNEITPYLVSRFYRAPEIILGLSYDHPVDIWSVGCCLYELYSGKVLFPGRSNNDMLRLHMELKGPFPKKMLRKGAFTNQHFDQNQNFLATEADPFTGKAVKRVISNIEPKSIRNRITSSPGEDLKMLTNFKDLLDKMFVLDPDKRMTVAQALAHPFISGKCRKT